MQCIAILYNRTQDIAVLYNVNTMSGDMICYDTVQSNTVLHSEM